ncbi:ferredoxin--NADP reductase [Allohahella marinimesophila]|uniref:ferredoxin--NADP(+) reductase n=1 Tax=Allohahella marinimesophila TaxID=1054972 RepID=A0ABP7Q5H9_9GAMM
MANLRTETVTSVHHWNDTLFSFKTSRDPSFRFKNGHFIMIGLEQEGAARPLMRAYSIASANYEEELEFFSIKVQDGPLTSKLQKIKVGDPIVMSNKPTGTLLIDHLLPGRNLYLVSTGTGLAPFMSIIKDPETYEKFDKVILTHGVRFVSELAYQDMIQNELPQNEFFGELIKNQLIYYPTVTREPYHNKGRLTDLMESGQLFQDIGLPTFDLESDRFMVCGSPSMLKDTCKILDERGFVEARQGDFGHYVIERAFVES